MSIRDSIISLFYGSCSIWESQSCPDENGVEQQQWVQVAANIECRVVFGARGSYSSHRLAAGHSHKNNLSYDITLFLPVEVMVKPGSRLEVNQGNQSYSFKCTSPGATYTYHREIKVLPMEREM